MPEWYVLVSSPGHVHVAIKTKLLPTMAVAQGRGLVQCSGMPLPCVYHFKRVAERKAGDLSVLGLCMRAGPHLQYLLVPDVNASKAEVVGSCTEAKLHKCVEKGILESGVFM